MVQGNRGESCPIVGVFSVVFRPLFRRLVYFPSISGRKPSAPPFSSVSFRLCRPQFQKCGLPHAHILIIVDGDEKPQPEDYNQYVSAELSDPDRQPRLFHRVVPSMVHGPCGSKCERDGVCSKGFVGEVPG